jgi:hypothetical protein
MFRNLGVLGLERARGPVVLKKKKGQPELLFTKVPWEGSDV